MDNEHQLVDYFSSNAIKLGFITRRQRDKLQVTDENGRGERVPERRVIALHGSAAAGDAGALRRIRERIEQRLAEIDTDLLWEALLDGADGDDSLSLEDAAREYFGESGPVERSAVARALAADPVHFKRRGVAFSVRAAEEVAEIRTLRLRRAEKAARRQQVVEWLDALLKGKASAAVPVPEFAEDFVRQTGDFLLAGHNAEAVGILGEARKSMNALEVALEVLKRTGRLPAGADPFLLVNGVHAGFSTAVLEHAEQLAEYAFDASRDDLTGLEVFSIDDDDTREIDDALSVEFDGDRTRVGIHIADPAYYVQKGDMLDRVAAARPLSLYLPTTTVTMFPERLSCDLASLTAGALRPSLSFLVTFAADGSVVDWSFGGAQVRVRHRLTYEEADEILADPARELQPALARLVALEEVLRLARQAAGGFTLSRPEFKIKVTEDDVRVRRLNLDSPSRRLVGEFMILANRLTADYALRHDLPVIYRVQDPPSEPVTSMSEYDPVVFDRQIRKLKRTRLSTHPQAHTGLGLDLYTQISSPIRRYADLVLARQLDAHFGGRELPYGPEELFEVVGTVEQTTQRNRDLEREAKRHWLLEYLRRHRLGAELDATVVTKEGRFVLAEVDEGCVRGVLFSKSDVAVGQRVKVRLRSVDSKAGKMVLDMV